MGDSEKDNATPETPEASQPESAEQTPAVESAAAAGEAPAAEEAPVADAPESAEAASTEGADAAAPAESEPTIEAPEAPSFPVPQADEYGRYYGTGRRKTSVARVYLRPGSGQIQINGRALEEVFTSPAWREHARSPLVFAGVSDQFDAQVSVRGGGSSGQSGAVRQGLARALILANPSLRPRLRQKGYLTRDPRMRERKKYGQKGARKRFQWTKR